MNDLKIIDESILSEIAETLRNHLYTDNYGVNNYYESIVPSDLSHFTISDVPNLIYTLAGKIPPFTEGDLTVELVLYSNGTGSDFIGESVSYAYNYFMNSIHSQEFPDDYEGDLITTHTLYIPSGTQLLIGAKFDFIEGNAEYRSAGQEINSGYILTINDNCKIEVRTFM